MKTYLYQTPVVINNDFCRVWIRQVLGCCFEADGGVVTCGEGHALFWKKEGSFLVKKKGVFGRKAMAQTLLCCSQLQGKVRYTHTNNTTMHHPRRLATAIRSLNRKGCRRSATMAGSEIRFSPKPGSLKANPDSSSFLWRRRAGVVLPEAP